MSKYITVSGSSMVDIDVLPEEVLDQIDTADLLAELERRKSEGRADWSSDEFDMRKMVDDYRAGRPIDHHIRTIAHVLYGMVL